MKLKGKVVKNKAKKKSKGKHATGYYYVCVFRVRVVRVTGPREARQFGPREFPSPLGNFSVPFFLFLSFFLSFFL